MTHPSIVEKVYTRSGRRMAFDAGMRVYNLGSGSQYYPGVTGVDLLPGKNVGVVCDLNQFPWPIETNSADAIFSFHSMEHLDSLPRVMEEIHRIGKSGARLIIEVPYFRSVGAFQDPTHRHFFTTRTMDYFSQNRSLHSYGYSRTSFQLKNFWLGWPARSGNPFAGLFKAFIRRFPNFYDSYLSLVIPVQIIVYELEVIKDKDASA